MPRPWLSLCLVALILVAALSASAIGPAAAQPPPAEDPTEAPSDPPPATETATPTETPTETPAPIPTAEPTAAPPTPPASPTATPTAPPTATPAPTEAPFQAAAIPPSNLRVTVSCRTNPEQTRVDNLGSAAVTIVSVGSIYNVKGYEPIAVSRVLGPGRTVIFRSGSGATSGTILTPSFIYDNVAYEREGAVVRISTGRGFTDRCDPRPAPRPTPTPTPRPPGGGCDPSYPTVCIPPRPPDLDCGDIPYRRFTVRQPDPHGFDGDHDGIGCESG